MVENPEQTLLEAIRGFRRRYPDVGRLQVVVPSWWAELHGRDVVTEHAARCNAVLHVVKSTQLRDRLQVLVYVEGSFVRESDSRVTMAYHPATTPRGYASRLLPGERSSFGKHRVYKYSGGWWFTCALCLASKPVVAWRQALDLLRLHVDGHWPR